MYGQCRAGAQIIFPESKRGLGRVTPTIFGSTVGYPSDSLASCYLLTYLRLVRTTVTTRMVDQVTYRYKQPAFNKITHADVHHTLRYSGLGALDPGDPWHLSSLVQWVLRLRVRPHWFELFTIRVRLHV